MNTSWRRRAMVLGGLILAAYFLLNLFPIYWMLVTSLKPDAEVYVSRPHYLPLQPTLANFITIYTTRPFGRYTFNTLAITVVTTLICILFGSVTAYGFSRFRFRGSSLMLFVVLATRIIPPIALVVPFFLLAGRLGLVDTLVGQIIVNTYMWLPFSIWIMASFFESVPRELDDAARIDGCSRLGSFARVAFPLALPGIAATAIIAFMGTWNEFLFNLILAPTPAAKNLSVGSSDFIADMFISWNQMAAGAFIASIPALVFVLIFQKYIVEGLVAGAVKG